MKIQFNDLSRQQEAIRQRVEERFKTVLDHGRYVMGPEIIELEEKLADCTGARHCLACGSGTLAIELALRARGIGHGDVVFTTPFTFIATAGAIALTGAKPVFVDIEADTFNIDPDQLTKVIEQPPAFAKDLRPRAIIAVDLFGQTPDYSRLQSIAQKHDLLLLEDAAQSFGARFGDKLAGNLADVAATSFFPAKPLGCYGDGGAVFTNDEQLYLIMKSIRNHGEGSHRYENIRVGTNGRIDSMQAAVLLEKLPLLDKEREAKQKLAEKYSAELASKYTTPVVREGNTSAWAQYSLLTENRDQILEKLQSAGVPTAVYYPIPLHLQGAFADLGYRTGDFPVSEQTAANIFSIPMHGYMTESESDFVIEKLLAAKG